MATQENFPVVKDSLQELKLRALYQIGAMQFVFPESVIKGSNGIVEAFPKQKNQQDALYVTVKTDQGEKLVGLPGRKGYKQ